MSTDCHVTKLSPQPGDIIVVRIPESLNSRAFATQAQAAVIMLKATLPHGVGALIVPANYQIGVQKNG